jgi:hypothetical protein
MWSSGLKAGQGTTVTVNKLHVSRSQQNRTTLQHEQRRPGSEDGLELAE